MNKHKKIVATILAATTLSTSLTLSFADTKSNSQKTKEEMKLINNERQALSKKTKQLESQVDKNNIQLKKVKSDLEDILERKIKNEELLEEIEKDLKNGVKQLKEQISTYYINSYSSNSTMLETFIKSESISDYIVTSNHIKFAVEDKDKKVNKVKRLLEEQKKIREEIKKDEENLKNAKESLDNELNKLQKTKAEYDSETRALNQKYDELEDILIVQQEEEERIKREILAAQEAAKQEALKQESNNKEETNKQETVTESNNTVNSTGWITPLKSYTRVTSLFGPRTHPVTGKYTNHGGMDIAAPTGTPVYSARAGKVIVSQYSGSYGNYIIVDHGEGYATLYAHLSARNVGVGTKVSAGQLIGKVGSTGRSTGPHLHLELRKNGEKIDPQSKIKF